MFSNIFSANLEHCSLYLGKDLLAVTNASVPLNIPLSEELQCKLTNKSALLFLARIALSINS